MKKFNDNVDNIKKAVETIESGVCKRIDVNKDIKVYECKNVIRIDIKMDGEE